MTRRSAPQVGASPRTPAKESDTPKGTSDRDVHLHLARLAGVPIDLILGDLADMGWNVTTEDFDLIAELSRARMGVVQ